MQVWATVELGAKLRESGFDRFKLLFVGGGPDFDELKAMVKRCGLVPYSIFTEWVPMEEVNRFVNVMDIVPLLESDPHGGSIVREAMACGRVALSVDGASGTQRRFMPPDCSILVSPEDYVGAAADAVLRLARDRSAMESMGRNARAYAREHMSFDAQANTLLEAIQQRGPIASDASKMLADNDPGQV
jgi:glycosyltransferase involved in cell wall biosynthesis